MRKLCSQAGGHSNADATASSAQLPLDEGMSISYACGCSKSSMPSLWNLDIQTWWGPTSTNKSEVDIQKWWDSNCSGDKWSQPQVWGRSTAVRISWDAKFSRRKSWLMQFSHIFAFCIGALVATTNNMKVLLVSNHILMQLQHSTLLEFSCRWVNFTFLWVGEAFTKSIPGRKWNVEISAAHSLKCTWTGPRKENAWGPNEANIIFMQFHFAPWNGRYIKTETKEK